jgi:formimidoylglutamate deiminase
MSRRYLCPEVLLAGGWAKEVVIQVAESGEIERVGGDAAGAERLRGPVLPGMANLHSHAFQRAMAGLSETAEGRDDSFWHWRELMYRIALRIGPDAFAAVARHLYIEMLKAGYTSVAEFHYLHHDEDGSPYADPRELSLRILEAADESGIGLTLLPVLYAHSGFGGKPPSDGQRRFIHSPESYLRLLEALAPSFASSHRRLGTCFHSLRAVTEEEMHVVLAGSPSTGAIHIHIAEQEKEVSECVQWFGQRPVQWLLDRANVDERWCLVHATHLDPHEVKALAKTRAVAGLCPTTEANLGDGIFPAVGFLQEGGRFGIGSDSQVSVSVIEELKWLEYGQRLREQRRNRLQSAGATNVPGFLYRLAARSGAQALAQNVGELSAGMRADLVVLDAAHPLLAHAHGDDILGRFVMAGSDRMVRDVMVAGQWQIREGRHLKEEEAGQAFASAVLHLLTESKSSLRAG